MAKLEETYTLKNVVVDVVFDGNYPRFIAKGEVPRASGDALTKRFTVWGSYPVAKGNIVSIIGSVSAKIGKAWTDKQGNTHEPSAELHINNAQVTVLGSVAEQAIAAVGGTPVDENIPF